MCFGPQLTHSFICTGVFHNAAESVQPAEGQRMVREFADKVFTKADEVCVGIWQFAHTYLRTGFVNG